MDGEWDDYEDEWVPPEKGTAEWDELCDLRWRDDVGNLLDCDTFSDPEKEWCEYEKEYYNTCIWTYYLKSSRPIDGGRTVKQYIIRNSIWELSHLSK